MPFVVPAVYPVISDGYPSIIVDGPGDVIHGAICEVILLKQGTEPTALDQTLAQLNITSDQYIISLENLQKLHLSGGPRRQE